MWDVWLYLEDLGYNKKRWMLCKRSLHLLAFHDFVLSSNWQIIIIDLSKTSIWLPNRYLYLQTMTKIGLGATRNVIFLRNWGKCWILPRCFNVVTLQKLSGSIQIGTHWVCKWFWLKKKTRWEHVTAYASHRDNKVYGPFLTLNLIYMVKEFLWWPFINDWNGLLEKFLDG